MVFQNERFCLIPPFKSCQNCFLRGFFDGKVLSSAWYLMNKCQTKVSLDQSLLEQLSFGQLSLGHLYPWTSVLWPNAEGVRKNLSPSPTGNVIGGIFRLFDLSLKPRPQTGTCSEVFLEGFFIFPGVWMKTYCCTKAQCRQTSRVKQHGGTHQRCHQMKRFNKDLSVCMSVFRC